MSTGTQSYLDRPDLDGTPRAHPSYWRGKATGISDILKIVSDIMMGHDNGTGVNNHPEVEKMRRGLLTWRDTVNQGLNKTVDNELKEELRTANRRIKELEKDVAALEKSLEKALK
jgi:hypothetical protein